MTSVLKGTRFVRWTGETVGSTLAGRHKHLVRVGPASWTTRSFIQSCRVIPSPVSSRVSATSQALVMSCFRSHSHRFRFRNRRLWRCPPSAPCRMRPLIRSRSLVPCSAPPPQRMPSWARPSFQPSSGMWLMTHLATHFTPTAPPCSSVVSPVENLFNLSHPRLAEPGQVTCAYTPPQKMWKLRKFPPGGWRVDTTSPVEIVEIVEVSTGGGTACRASLRLTGRGSAQRARLSPRRNWRSFSGGFRASRGMRELTALRSATGSRVRRVSGVHEPPVPSKAVAAFVPHSATALQKQAAACCSEVRLAPRCTDAELAESPHFHASPCSY
jgi:hypothetical protein